jgi:hypothetical protein
MSTPYSGNAANNPTSITIPSDGDDKPAVSVNASLEGLMDKIAHTQLPATDDTESYPLATRTVSRVMRGVATSSETAGVSDWAVQNGINGAIFLQATLAGTAVLYQPLDLPDGCTLSSVLVWLDGSGGHGGLPGTMPTARLFKADPTTLTVTQIGITTGDPSNLAAYEAIHFISIGGGIGEVIDNSIYRYVVGITGEAGANSIAGLRYVATKCACIVGKQDPGAS